MSYITLYRRHGEDCRSKRCTCGATETNAKGHKSHKKTCEGIDKNYRRCECSVWFETNEQGKQRQWCSKETSWAAAERKARQIEGQFNGTPSPKSSKNATVKDAVESFLIAKRNENLASDTLYRHEHIMELFLNFCERQGIMFIRDVTVDQLNQWQNEWTLVAPQAKNTRKEKVRNFFKYCVVNGKIEMNPSHPDLWKNVRLKNGIDAVRPFEPEAYEKIIAAIDRTTMTDENKARIRAVMQLQRWSGLSLVDAVCLAKDELVEHKGKFRVRRERQKTKHNDSPSRIDNVIPTWLAKELLKVKNGNPKYFFWSGTTTPEDAPSYFQKLYRRVFKAADIEGSSHDLRHTFAVELLKKGIPTRRVQMALGHKSVQVTEHYYAKWCKSQQEALDKDLEAAWE